MQVKLDGAQARETRRPSSASVPSPAAMNFAALKAKAVGHQSSVRLDKSSEAYSRLQADGVKDARARATEPSRPTAKYKPVRPEDLAGQRQLSAGERYQQSTVLQHQQAIHRPPPPPIRSRSSGGSPATTSANEYFQEKAASPPPAPARKYGAPAAPAPAPPPRTPSTSGAPPAPPPRSGSTRSIPAPPYQHAITHDLPKPAPPPRSTPAPPAPAPRQALSASTISSSTETFKKFSEYDSADKELMFSMLDEVSCSRRRVGVGRDVDPVSYPVLRSTLGGRHLQADARGLRYGGKHAEGSSACTRRRKGSRFDHLSLGRTSTSSPGSHAITHTFLTL